MKELISWNDTLSVTINSVDQQHKQLVTLANNLNAAMGAGAAKDDVDDVLKRLINYTVTHFKHEETLMRQYAYPGFVKHGEEHEDLIKKLVDFQKKFASGQVSVNAEVMLFLKTWLTTHIEGSDKRMGAFLGAKKAA